MISPEAGAIMVSVMVSGQKMLPPEWENNSVPNSFNHKI
jgi:hypothetical protein